MSKKYIYTQDFIDEDGSVKTITYDRRIFYTYVLCKDGVPVYVGCTTDISKRITTHKKNRLFNGYFIASKSFNKTQANSSEKTLIAALKLLYPFLENKNSCDTHSLLIGV